MDRREKTKLAFFELLVPNAQRTEDVWARWKAMMPIDVNTLEGLYGYHSFILTMICEGFITVAYIESDSSPRDQILKLTHVGRQELQRLRDLAGG